MRCKSPKAKFADRTAPLDPINRPLALSNQEEVKTGNHVRHVALLRIERRAVVVDSTL